MADPTPPDSSNLLATLARSGRMRIAAALVVTALVGGGLGVIMLRGDSGGKALLYSGLDLAEAGEMASKLDAAGVKYDLTALTSSASNVLMVPIFLAALMAARGLPALLYRRVLDARHTLIAGLMQATRCRSSSRRWRSGKSSSWWTPRREPP